MDYKITPITKLFQFLTVLFMTREEFKNIAEIRIREARCLLDQGLNSGAYYLAGYALECAIKACLSKQILQHNIPENKFIKEIHTHDLQKLIKFDEELSASFREQSGNNDFITNWSLVKDWSEQSRYKTYNKNQAEELIEAITKEKGGVLPWIQQYW